jgi:hypothetical protein
MTSLEIECQYLADRYCMAIKEIRLIRKTDPAQLIFAPKRKEPDMSRVFINMPFNKEFSEFTEEYRSVVQEVRVIYFNGCGAVQFFPAGTPDKVVLNANISPDELNL